MINKIDEQGKYIGELNTEIDTTTQKLNFVQQKLGKLLKTNGNYYIICRHGTNLYNFNTFCYTHNNDLLGHLYMIAIRILFLISYSLSRLKITNI